MSATVISASPTSNAASPTAARLAARFSWSRTGRSISRRTPMSSSRLTPSRKPLPVRATELIDEIVVHIVPVLLGAGTPLYQADGEHLRPLDLIETSAPGELTTLKPRPRYQQS